MRIQKIVLAVVTTTTMGAVLVFSQRSTNVSKHEAAEREAIGILKDLESAMTSISDKESARIAAPRMHAVCDRVEALIKTMADLPKLTPDENRTLRENYDPVIAQINSRMFGVGQEAARNSQGDPAFLAAVQRLEQVSDKLRKLVMVGRSE